MLTHAGVIQILFSNRTPLFDGRLKEIELRLQLLSTTPHSIVNAIGGFMHQRGSRFWIWA